MSSESDSSDPVAPKLEDLAPLFPAYELEGFIAQGGMGAVYKAQQVSLDRPVAIKILPRELGGDPVFRASFEAEARAMARLNHPNLVGVYDFGEADGMLFIIMEYVHGNSLHRSCHGKTIDPTQAGEIVSAISRGLAHAHQHGILHRDIKPGNILIDAKAMPKIGDFGLAFPMGEQAGPEDTIYGTPGYAAPEIYRKDPAGPRSDIYSVGILLSELLTGIVPEENGRPSPPSLACGCPREFDAIVARATNANPELRYPDANALADDLDKAVEIASKSSGAANRLITTPPPTVLKTATATVSGSPPHPGSIVPAPKKSLALPLSLCAVAVAIAFYAVKAGTGGGDDDPSQTAKIPEVEQPAMIPGGGDEPIDPNEANAIFAGGGNLGQDDKGTDMEPEKEDLKPESPLESLAKLKAKLASGKRDEFPVGTEARGESQLLLVDRELTWADARRFAEEHGAHLAVFSVPSDRLWFRDTFKPESPVWIGAGLAARERWQWLDGSRWIPIDNPTTAAADQRLMTLSSIGQLSPASTGQSLQFAIQWRNDGENPATVGAELQRATDSIKSVGVDTATYPVGTRSYPEAGSHFYAINNSSSWESARKLALAASGYLAVPSSDMESDWLLSNFSKVKSPDTPSMLWIGGYRLKPMAPWQWLTREAWNASAWLFQPDANDANIKTVCLRIGEDTTSSGWVASSGADGDAMGLLVEWSKPKQAAAIVNFDLESWLGDIDEKFVERVRPDVEKYEKERDQEVAKYVKEMRREAKKLEDRLESIGFGGRGGGAIIGLVDEQMEDVENTGEILGELPRFVPGEFRKIQDDAKSSLEKMEEEYQAKLTADLETYTSGLVIKAATIGKSGFDKAEATLNQRVDSIGDDTEKFLDVLGLAESPE
ncbi:MAG: serine/threonine protein kinase [Verrucomicrobiales bacterium]|jgi:serine/threonine protein kinase